MTTAEIVASVFPNGEKADPKTIAAKMQSMFAEVMLKTMEDSVEAEDGLFSQSSTSEIFRGMLREHLAAALSTSIGDNLEVQLEEAFRRQTEPSPDASQPASPQITMNQAGSDLPVTGVITSPAGWRRDPFSGNLRLHKGTDVAAAYGSPITAVADGIVTESGPKGSYGNVVVIETDDGRRMLYGHNQVNLVQMGDRVQRGQVIAQVGSTGRATGPHVHFEVTDDFSLKSVSGLSDKTGGKGHHQPSQDGPGALNE